MIRQFLYNTLGLLNRVITPGTQKCHMVFDYNYSTYQTGTCNLSHIEGWCQIIGPKNKAFGKEKGQIHLPGFNPSTCDKNQVSQEFSELISTETYGISTVLRSG